MHRAVPAYAGASSSGRLGTYGLSHLGARRQRLWVAVLALLGLAVPYTGTTFVTLQRVFSCADQAAVTLPALSLPGGDFPRLPGPATRRARGTRGRGPAVAPATQS